MTDRHQRIIRLLQTRDDGLPQPVRRDHSQRGFKDNVPARESCPDCLANDRVLKTCETCHGRGYTETNRKTDPYKNEKTMGLGFTPDRHERDRERDATIERLEAQTAPPKSEADVMADANAHPEPWELARRKMYRLYDYAALDLALEQLRDRHQDAYHLIHSVYVYGWSEASTTVEMLVARALVFIDERMPEEIRAPGFENDGGAQRKASRRQAA